MIVFDTTLNKIVSRIKIANTVNSSEYSAFIENTSKLLYIDGKKIISYDYINKNSEILVNFDDPEDENVKRIALCNAGSYNSDSILYSIYHKDPELSKIYLKTKDSENDIRLKNIDSFFYLIDHGNKIVMKED